MTRSNNLIYSTLLSIIILFTVLSFATALAGNNRPSHDVGSKASALSGKVAKDSGGFCDFCLDETGAKKI